MDSQQVLLSITFGFTAATSSLWFVNELLWPLTAVGTIVSLLIVYRMGQNWALVYPDSVAARLLGSSVYRHLPQIVLLLVVVAAIALGAAIYFTYRTY